MHILFVTATRIGDAVLSTGLLSYVIERFPDARLTIAAGPLAAPLFEEVPGLERVLVVRKRRAGLHWLTLYARTASRRWDLVVDLRGSGLAWMLRAGERRVMAALEVSTWRTRKAPGRFATKAAATGSSSREWVAAPSLTNDSGRGALSRVW